MKVAFVIQRYGLEINGGAELHCRYIAQRLAKHMDVTVLTTCAQDYITWKNHYRQGQEKINDIEVIRFPVTRERDPVTFGRMQDRLFQFPHTPEEELDWLEEEGPNSPEMIRYLKKHKDLYDFFIFFSYRYYHSFHGIHAVPHKSILVPTAEPDPVINFSIFKGLFHLPQAIVYNSPEEKRMIQSLSSNYQVPGDIVGVGSEIPARADGASFRRKYGINDPFLLYIGRIDENKGCRQLFEFFIKFRSEVKSNIKLVLVGSEILKVPQDEGMIHLGFLSDEEKFNALDASEMLVMPSFYESLSMVLLEAWAMGKPTLANANCRVLLGQTVRSNAGLFYADYIEFKKCLQYLLTHPKLRHVLGRNGRRFFGENYRWEIIEQKYLKLMEAARN